MIRSTHAPSKRTRKKCRTTIVLLDDVDVSTRCFYADDRVGLVGLYKLNVDGRRYVDRSKVAFTVAVEWKHGAVRMKTKKEKS